MKEVVTSMLQRLLQGPELCYEKSYSLSEVADHCHCNDCWVVICDHVYDVTTFLDQHPGGFDVLMEHAGRDATVAFYSSGHLPNTIDILRPFCVGTLAQIIARGLSVVRILIKELDVCGCSEFTSYIKPYIHVTYQAVGSGPISRNSDHKQTVELQTKPA